MTARVCRECGVPIYWEQGVWYHGTPRKRVELDHVAIPSRFTRTGLTTTSNTFTAHASAVGECSTESGAA